MQIDKLNKNIQYFILANNLTEWRRLQDLFFSLDVKWIYNKEKYFDGYPDHGKNIEFSYPKWMSIIYINNTNDEYDWVMTTDDYDYEKKIFPEKNKKILNYFTIMRYTKLERLQKNSGDFS